MVIRRTAAKVRPDLYNHAELTDDQVRAMLKCGDIKFAGHKGYKVWGLLTCATGKKMKRENRVFFTSQEAAEKNGYRPCGSCQRAAFNRWKSQQKTHR